MFEHRKIQSHTSSVERVDLTNFINTQEVPIPDLVWKYIIYMLYI